MGNAEDKDVVERLRYLAEDLDLTGRAFDTINEAATEIERLRVACQGALTACAKYAEECVILREWHEALKAEVERLRKKAHEAIDLAQKINERWFFETIAGAAAR